MELKNIKTQTTWSEAAESINSNNLKIITEVTKLQDATYKSKGYFKTLSDLQSAFPTAAVGSKAYVGLSYPYAIYLWENNSWVDSGATGGEEAVNLEQFYTKDETDTKLTELSERIDDLPQGDGPSYDDTELRNELNKKVNKTDMATINGKSLTEGGNIVIEGGTSVTPDWNASEGEAGYIDNRTHCIDYKNLTDITVDDEKYELSMVEEDGVYVFYARLKQQLQRYGDNYNIVYKKPLHEYGPDINESDLYYDVVIHITDDWPSPTPPEFGWDAKLEFVNDEYDGHKELVLRSYGTIRGEKLYISGPYGVPIMQIETHFIPNTIARQESVDELREETTALWENLDHGTFPNLTAGDLAGRGESVPASFGFRASGGKSIKDGRAYIKRIKGNSVVWNQSCKPFSEAIRFPHDSVIVTEQGVSLTNWDAYQPFVLPANLLAKKGHKCLLMFSYTNTTPSPQFVIEVAETTETRFPFTQASESVAIFLNVAQSSITDNINVFPYVNQTGECTISNIRFYDLTKMFQAGNEPSTIEDFNARVATLGVDMYAYNEGQVIHCNTESIKSVGDNAWDEEWENGTFDITSGEAIDGSWVMGQIRSENPLPVLPNEEYYVSMGKGSIWVIFLGKEGNVIESPAHNGVTAGNAINISNSGRFKTPTNAAFLIFYCTEDYGSTYNHDILISLYHSGWKAQKDDQYQPYWQDTLPLPIIRKYFPDGMKSAGTAKDEIRYNKASGKWEYSKGRIKSVDLGTLVWNYPPTLPVFMSAVISDMRAEAGVNVGLTGKYSPAQNSEGQGMMEGTEDKVYVTNGGWVGGNGVVAIRDTSYTDVESFKAALQGVILYYESNDWEWKELDAEDQNFRDYYQVADFGTEMSQSDVPSAAFSADIIYQFNAVDMIREHEMEINELQSIIATMQAQLTSLINK